MRIVLKPGVIFNRFALLVVLCGMMCIAMRCGAQQEPAQSAPSSSQPASPSSKGAPETPPQTDKSAVGGTSPAVVSDSHADEVAPQHLRFVDPPPVLNAWSQREKIAWVVCLILALVAYFAVMIAMRAVRMQKSELRSIQELIESMVANSETLAKQAQSSIVLHRPWIRMRVERSIDVSNMFHILATNEGRTPAEIIQVPGKIRLNDPEARKSNKDLEIPGHEGASAAPIVLFPNESAVVASFGRADVNRICQTEEVLNRIRRCEGKVLVFGSVVYRDTISTADQNTHRTDWCFRYVHGEGISDMVPDGSLELNRYT